MNIILDLQRNSIELYTRQLYCETSSDSLIGLLLQLAENNRLSEINFILPDMTSNIDWSNSLLISERFTKNTVRFLKQGAIPFLIILNESPQIDVISYLLLEKYLKNFMYIIGYTNFNKMELSNRVLAPNWINEGDKKKYFTCEKQKFLTLISSNKTVNINRSISKQNVINLLYKIIKVLVPKINSYDLYKQRDKAIIELSTYNDFDLYGKGWDNLSRFKKSDRMKIQNLSPVEINNKFDILNKYSYAICFENSCYAGYITEKIYDCFCSGTIPVYYGAPDIEKYIDKDLFIDFRYFKDFREMYRYLKSLTPSTESKIRGNIYEYIHSNNFENTTKDYLSGMLVDLILENKTTSILSDSE